MVLLSPPKVPVPGDTSLARIQSHPLRRRFSTALATTFSVSAAKPTTRVGRSLRRGAVAARGSRVSTGGGRGGAPPPLFHFLPRPPPPPPPATAPPPHPPHPPPPVETGGRHDRDIDRQCRLARRQHLPRGLDRDQPHPGRGRLLSRP